MSLQHTFTNNTKKENNLQEKIKMRGEMCVKLLKADGTFMLMSQSQRKIASLRDIYVYLDIFI